MIDLAFPGYRSFGAAPDDPFRVKWNAVRFLLDVPASVAPIGTALDKISAQNAAINSQIVYTPELDGSDVWQTPTQTLLLAQGDCEDYAILKYAVLTKAGIPARVVIGEIKSALKTNPAHAWCAAYLDGAWRALDNKFDQIIRVDEYLNWIPLAAMHDASVVRFGREFTMAEMMRVK